MNDEQEQAPRMPPIPKRPSHGPGQQPSNPIRPSPPHQPLLPISKSISEQPTIPMPSTMQSNEVDNRPTLQVKAPIKDDTFRPTESLRPNKFPARNKIKIRYSATVNSRRSRKLQFLGRVRVAHFVFLNWMGIRLLNLVKS
jgi:hypothetical protein